MESSTTDHTNGDVSIPDALSQSPLHKPTPQHTLPNLDPEPAAVSTSPPASNVASNILQLCSIDQTIVELMTHTASALDALGGDASSVSTAPPSKTTPPPPTGAQRLQAFQAATESFLSALHSVDVRMKRQLWVLEEAGILNFGNDLDDGDGGGDRAKKPKPTVAPNAMGLVGELDQGWLNSRIASGGVEKERQAEMWARARIVLEAEVAKLSRVDIKGEGE